MRVLLSALIGVRTGLAIALMMLLVTACGGGDSGAGIGSTGVVFAVGGNITGLSDTVVLQNNGSDMLSRSANGQFTFSTPLPPGGGYNVKATTQPAGQTCVVTNGIGTITSASITDIAVSCTNSVAGAFSIGVTISGLSGTVAVEINGGSNSISRSVNGDFTLSAPLAAGSAYNVTVGTQPFGQTCSVSNGSGTVGAANITNALVVCANNAVGSFTIGGAIFGLSGTVVLQNNSTDGITRASNGDFSFFKAIAKNSGYSVTVQTHPAGQTCKVSNGSGLATANVTNVQVSCITNSNSATYSIGGTIVGLVGTVILQNNGGSSNTRSTDGQFTFAPGVAKGGGYNVTVFSQPSNQVCAILNGIGVVNESNIVDIKINCLSDPASAVPRRMQPIWNFNSSKLQNPVSIKSVGFDLGDVYVWVHVGFGGKEFSVLKSKDLQIFEESTITLDGKVAGSLSNLTFLGARTQTTIPPTKLVSFKGKYYGIPRFDYEIHGPSNLYTSSDAVNWSSVPPIKIGGTVPFTTAAFRNVDDNTCTTNYKTWQCFKVQDISASKDKLFLVVHSVVLGGISDTFLLQTSDGVSWAASMITSSSGSTLVIGANSMFFSGDYISNNGGVTWQKKTPITNMGSFTLDARGFRTGDDVTQFGGTFIASGGYSYRPYYFASKDGVTWDALPIPPTCVPPNSPVNTSLAFTGELWVNLTETCLGNYIVGLAQSSDGINWNTIPLTGADALLGSDGWASETYIKMSANYGVIGSSIQSLNNVVIVRGTNDIVTTGFQGSDRVLVRVHY